MIMKKTFKIFFVFVLILGTVFINLKHVKAVDEVVRKTLVHTSSAFTYSGSSNWTTRVGNNHWEGGSDLHVWSKKPSLIRPSVSGSTDLWYEVRFEGTKIDIYAGKNHPMGKVDYYVDGVLKATADLYNRSNINEVKVATIDGLEDKPHILRAVAKEDKLIDAAKVVVYGPNVVLREIDSKDEYSVPIGGNFKMEVKPVPEQAELGTLKYEVRDSKKVSVENGTITGLEEGETIITISSGTIKKEVKVKVIPQMKSIRGSIVSTNKQVLQKDYDALKNETTSHLNLTAWKNDTVNTQLALLSIDSSLEQVSIEASPLTSTNATISQDNIKATFVKPTLAYVGNFLGYGANNTNSVPAITSTNRAESSDILYQMTPIDMKYNSVQPVHVAISIPKNSQAGDYVTTLTVNAKGLTNPLTFTLNVKVYDAVLPDVSEFKNKFDLELWQYPYSSAEYYKVQPFSEEHLEILKSHINLYKKVGGNTVTATIVEEPWQAQTYSENPVHYPSMIKWTKNRDNTFSYDYSDFDSWIKLNKDLGTGDKIVMYSIAPWHKKLTYRDENNNLVYENLIVGSPRYIEVWTHFLKSLVEHLESKGWFDSAYIGIDERGFDKVAFDLIASIKGSNGKPLKTAAAVDDLGNDNKFELAQHVTNLTIGDFSAEKYKSRFELLLKMREEKRLMTTLYSCTEHLPGNFLLSQPVESYFTVINAGRKTNGFLRWAYDAWVKDPLKDGTHNALEPGDTFVVYPNNETKEARSSIRLEKLAEGVRDVNKIRKILQEIPSLQNDVDEMYAKVATRPRHMSYQGTVQYLSDFPDQLAQLESEMNEFKADLSKLTEKYILLKTNGNFRLDKISFKEKEITIKVGETKRLEVLFEPQDTLSNAVVFESENSKTVSVDKLGTISGLKIGYSIVNVTSKVNKALTDTIKVNVVGNEIPESAKFASYSFENNIKDNWGTRNGEVKGIVTFEDGKVGKAVRLNGHMDSYVSLPESNLNTKQNWTVSYWMKVDEAPIAQSLMFEDAGRNTALALRLGDGEKRNASGFRDGRGDGNVLTMAYNFQPREWHHVTWVSDTKVGLKLFVNGKLIQTNDYTARPNVSAFEAPLEIIGGKGFKGLIDEVKIYNKALNDGEVLIDGLEKGLNIKEDRKDIFIGEEYAIDVNLITQDKNKDVIFTTDNDVVKVDKYGNVVGLKRGTAKVTVSGGGFTEIVTINVNKKVPWSSNVIPRLILPDANKTILDSRPNETETTGRYLGQPDMIRTKTGRLIVAYPKGHGKGPVVMQYSDDDAKSWKFLENTPTSWLGSQETPTLYTLQLANGKERIMMINANPGWGMDSNGQSYGWNTSYSDDNGNTWTEYKHWYPTLNNANNRVIVAMASLVQLKDENGNDKQEWMGVYHTDNPYFINYKTILSFDENGNESWSEPVPYLSEHSAIERLYQICEVGMFRAPDGKIVALARSQSHNHLATMFYSEDEGKTWSKPVDLPGTLAGERHKIAIDPISKRLVVTFREIQYDIDYQGKLKNWKAGEWLAWVGSYEQLMNLDNGDYNIELAKDYAPSPKSGDTGYAGNIALPDGTFVQISYGHWNQAESSKWVGVERGVYKDLVEIMQARYSLGELENLNDLVSRTKLNEMINKAIETIKDEFIYTFESLQLVKEALDKAMNIKDNQFSQQVEINNATSNLEIALKGLEKVNLFPSVTLSDSSTGVAVEAQDGVLPRKVQLSVEKVENKLSMDALIHNITLNVEETKIQPNGKVIVTIPVDSNKEVESVYYVLNNELKDKQNIVQYVKGDNVIKFEATHFSEYAVVYVSKSQISKPQINNQIKENKSLKTVVQNVQKHSLSPTQNRNKVEPLENKIQEKGMIKSSVDSSDSTNIFGIIILIFVSAIMVYKLRKKY